MSLMFKPARFKAIGAAIVGAVVNQAGACSPSAKLTIRAIGVKFKRLTAYQKMVF